MCLLNFAYGKTKTQTILCHRIFEPYGHCDTGSSVHRSPREGKLIDLSAGGMAILINQIIPQGTKLHLCVTFPDHSKLETDIEIKHTLPREKNYLHGVEFLTLEPAWVERLTKLSADYIDCEQRIASSAANPCVGAECAFFTMCSKPERTHLLVNIDDGLLLEFKHLQTLP